MQDQATISARYLELLMELDFDIRYYDYALNSLSRTAVPDLTRADWEEVLNELALSFDFNATDNFFKLEDDVVGGCRLGLLLAMTNGTLEAILSVDTRDHAFGGPFQVLAYRTGQLRNPGFAPKPPYPTLFCLNRAQLREAIRFCLRLFDRVRDPILRLNGCS
jgi:hypothetical protein